MSAQLIESSPVEPLVVGVHLYPGDTWFREVHVRSVTTQAPVDLSAWVFEARLGEHVGVVDASRAAEGRLAMTFSPEQTADVAWGDEVTLSGTLAGGRRTFLHGSVGAAVGSSIPVGPAQKTRVVSSGVDISVYAAPRGDKGEDGSAVSVALVQRAEAAEGRAVSAAGVASAAAGDAMGAASAAAGSASSAGAAAGVAAGNASTALSAAQGIVAARDAAAVSAGKANADADRAGTSAFNAGQSATAAQSSEDDARGFAVEAKGSRDAAEQARDLALAGQFLGTALTSATDLNAITTPGVYRCPSGAFATSANNYPAAGVAGVLTVTQWGGVGQVVQRYTPYPSTGTPNIIVGEWIRAYRGSAFSAWRFMASQRIDQTAGRAIYTLDDVNGREQLIYGDTGSRNVTALLSAEWTGSAYLRRVGQTVSVNVNAGSSAAVPANTTILTLPSGFRPDGTINKIIAGGNVQHGVVTDGNGITRADTALTALRWYFSFTTSDPWPTSLPGTAAGSIPT
ncbi:pyocin knob domain-containing protein [uncultured Microbacterium sp.]|uniref:pyocin knob domain-containing protein n=1 Tax=uncultured Microbacterium sp. TaxID=191216 RepID=UPI0025F0F24D|nr:pyocin knob domain-containing protein [uncultured Microbacterium sp.]